MVVESIVPDLHDSCRSGSPHRSGTSYSRIYMAARSGSTLVPDLAATDLLRFYGVGGALGRGGEWAAPQQRSDK